VLTDGTFDAVQFSEPDVSLHGHRIESGPVCLTLLPMLYQQIARAQFDTAILVEHAGQKLLAVCRREDHTAGKRPIWTRFLAKIRFCVPFWLRKAGNLGVTLSLRQAASTGSFSE
jgi:hypothetical protein